MQPSELKSIILKRFQPELGDLRVTDVHMKFDRDYMGDPIWLIEMHIDADVADLKGKRLFRAVNGVISDLQNHQEPGFPVFSFLPRRAIAPAIV